MSASTVVVREVWDDNEGVFLVVRPYTEAPFHAIEIASEGDRNVEYFGRISLAVDPDYALALGQALIAAATEMKKQ